MLSCGSFQDPMSIRFLPQENENDDPEAEAAKKAAEEAERKKQEEFDKARQRADQEAANAQKARSQAAEATRQIEILKQENEEMQSNLEALKSKAEDSGIDLNEDDFEDSDVTLVKAIKALDAKLTAKDARIKDLEKARDGLLKEREASKAASQRNSVYEELLSDLDEEYGPQHRNAAVKRFSELQQAGKVPVGNPTKATRILEKCYKETRKAADEKAKVNPSDPSLDPGSGGGSPNLNRVKLKPGSLAEVSAQLRAASIG